MHTHGGYFRSRHLARAEISALGPKGLNMSRKSWKCVLRRKVLSEFYINFHKTVLEVSEIFGIILSKSEIVDF